jgi:uncharacterized membrane protein (DUF373 family)
MENMAKLKDQYHFTDEDARNLHDLLPVADEFLNNLTGYFMEYLFTIPETERIILHHSSKDRLEAFHRQWFRTLFQGEYDEEYLSVLKRVGQAHVRVGLPVHYVNAAMSHVRHAIQHMIHDTFSDRDQRRMYRESADKIIDLNLAVMTSSYRDAEMSKVFVSRSLESWLIRLSERFTYGLNLVLVLSLAGVSMGVVGLFISDILEIFTGKPEKAIFSALGSMLILWMMIELLENEIKNLKGGSFNILVFVGVVVVAMVREILISTLRHDDLKTQAFLTLTLLVLGIVYFLVSKAQKCSFKE